MSHFLIVPLALFGYAIMIVVAIILEVRRHRPTDRAPASGAGDAGSTPAGGIGRFA